MRCRMLAIGALALGLSGWTVPLDAQPVVTGVQQLDSDRPEAWAIQYFTSTTLLDGYTAPMRQKPGSILLGAEIIWVPFLSEDKRRVGFNGTKLEDLNQTRLFARPRVTVGLPADFAATFAFVPPIELSGVTPKLFAVALERPIYDSSAWTLGWRAYGQAGTAKASFTCSNDVVEYTPGSAENAFRCLEPSSDVATLRYLGLQVGVGTPPTRAVATHVAVAVNYYDNEFEVNSRRLGALGEYIDRTMQRSHGTRVSVTGGIGLPLADRLLLAFDLFYTPLWVRRPGLARRNEGLFTAKALVSYKLR